MKKKTSLEEALKKAEPMLKKRSEAANEMVTDVAKQIMSDQQEWLDAQMKDLLPPHLYEAGRRMEKEEEIAAYVAKHKIRIIFVPDAMVIRIMLGDRVHSQFVTKLTCDGEPVKVEAVGFAPDPYKN